MMGLWCTEVAAVERFKQLTQRVRLGRDPARAEAWVQRILGEMVCVSWIGPESARHGAADVFSQQDRFDVAAPAHPYRLSQCVE